jgi:hypothetical protein
MRLVDWRAASEKGWSEEDWDLVEGRLVLKPALAGPPERRQLQQPAAHPLLTVPLAALGQAGKAISSLLGQTKTFAALFSFLGSNWWQLGMRGNLPSFLCPPECRGQLDFVAFDYYYGTELLHQIGSLLDVLERRYERAPIWPGAFYDALKYFQAMFPHLPLFVVENGVAAPPDGRQRANYLRDHVRQLQLAHRDGVKLLGYLAWSLTTNREWGLPHGPAGDFGLYHVDLDDDPALRRQWTPAVDAFRAIALGRSASVRF